MVQRIMQAVADYEDHLRDMQSLPRFSYGRGMVRKDGAPNWIFLTYLFGPQELAIQFLKDVGLIRGQVQCHIILIIFTLTILRLGFELFSFLCHVSTIPPIALFTSIQTILRLGFELFFLVPRTYNSANSTIHIYTNHLKVGV